MASIIWLLTGLFICSVTLTGAMLLYARNKNLLDVPNLRSSHTVATPRGGGLAFVIVFFIGVIYFWVIGTISIELIIPLVFSGALVAGIGFWDDHGHINIKWRLLSHFLAALWAIYWFKAFSISLTADYIVSMGWLVEAISAIFLVWLLNLFNFMDGIDGIAGSEAVFIAFGGALLSWLAGLEDLSLVLLILAFATLGFLVWNWPPAKIFMGDVGSGFLGITLGILAYLSANQGVSIWSWFILFGIFLVDATLTLMRRFVQGEKWYEAHRSHAYQWAARKWGHFIVTISVNLLNLFWLLPLAYLAFIYPDQAYILFLIAYLPLIFLAVKLGAGKAE